MTTSKVHIAGDLASSVATLKHRPPRTAIVTICWNSEERVTTFLRGLNAIQLQNTDIIVVDNNSTNPFSLRLESSNIIVIRVETNLGFAGGSNKGIQYAIDNHYDYVWILNNDLEIEPGCLERLVSVAEKDMTIGALSPQIFDLEDKSHLQFCGAAVDIQNFEIVYFNSIYGIPKRYKDNILLWGTAMLIRCSSAKAVGLLDESYFAYWEDFEFSKRLVHKAYKTRVVSEARCFHQLNDGTQTSRRAPFFYYYMTRNQYYFWTDSCESGPRRVSLNLTFLRHTLESISGRLAVADVESATAAVQGYIDALRGTTGVYTPRTMYFYCKIFFFAPHLLSKLLKGDFSYLFRRRG